GRPVTSHRLWIRVGDALRGSSASRSCATKRSSRGIVLSLMIALSASRLPEYFWASFRRFLSRCTALIFAIAFYPPALILLERHIHAAEKLARLLVRLSRRADDDVHAPNLVDLVVLDLREHDLLTQAERVVPASVEALRRHAAEVTDTRQGNRDQTVEE